MRPRDAKTRLQSRVALTAIALGFALYFSVQTALAGNIAATATRPMPALPTATITIVRSQEELYHAVRVVIDLNGRQVATLAAGQTFSQSVPIGPTVLTVSAPPLPGSSMLRFNADPGSLFQLLVTPRIQNVRSKIDNGIADRLREGSGPFIIVPVDVD
jgi:hypothetical protein